MSSGDSGAGADEGNAGEGGTPPRAGESGGEAGTAGGSGEAGSGGGGTGESACDAVPRDIPVSAFTEADAAANCRCGQERMPDRDWLRGECTGKAVWASESPAECERMVEDCIARGITCVGSEQIQNIGGCDGTLPELEDCFRQATDWQFAWTCAVAGPDNEDARLRDAPTCLADACGVQL